MLHLLVLGSAAGGGFPQWNCNDEVSRRARAGDPRLKSRTQSSLAVSADGLRWVLLNASPDLRQQINERPQLQPHMHGPARSSPIEAVVLTNGDVDHVAGLLSLREGEPLALYAHDRILRALAKSAIFDVLSPACVARRGLPLDVRVALADRDGTPLDVEIIAFPVAGKIALWLEDPDDPALGTELGDTVGLEIRSSGTPAAYFIPGCAEMTDDLARRLRNAELVFFDGTFWQDDEMIARGVGSKTARRMGHVSCSGPDGTIAAFSPLGVRRKIFTHINNTNPLLVEDSAERMEAERAGWQVAHDGMEIVL